MKITNVQTRSVAVDATPYFAGAELPADGQPIWEYPLVTIATDDGLTWSDPRFVLANAAMPVSSGLRSVNISYCDLLVDGPDLHLIVPHHFQQVVHLRFTESDLDRFPTRDELRASADNNHWSNHV